MRESSRAFPWLWTVVLVTAGLLVVSVLLPSTGSRHPADRAVSAANLRGIGQSMHIYAQDNDGWFPVSPHKRPPDEGDPRAGAASEPAP